MNDKILYIVVSIAIPVALALCVILALGLRRAMAVAKLYGGRGRDLRFVCALLRHYLPGGKWRILRNPCLLSDHRGVPPRADLIVIGGGGVLILTVDDRPGHFSTPSTGDWTYWQDGEMVKIPNRFVEGRQYTAVVNGLLVRAGISCPVLNIIVLSDDHAGADDLYAENVMTGNQLVPYVKRFCKGGMLSSKEQQRLRQIIATHHTKSRKALEAGDPAAQTAGQDTGKFTAANLFDTPEAPARAADSTDTVICPSCGERMPARFRVCGVCGTPLRSEGDGANQ
ncbi:MAG: NERD domain-containing protein [Clostridia bacterium]|nr:NERD domain-containing protein [Clostridia bacterium]